MVGRSGLDQTYAGDLSNISEFSSLKQALDLERSAGEVQ